MANSVGTYKPRGPCPRARSPGRGVVTASGTHNKLYMCTPDTVTHAYVKRWRTHKHGTCAWEHVQSLVHVGCVRTSVGSNGKSARRSTARAGRCGRCERCTAAGAPTFQTLQATPRLACAGGACFHAHSRELAFRHGAHSPARRSEAVQQCLVLPLELQRGGATQHHTRTTKTTQRKVQQQYAGERGARHGSRAHTLL